MDSRRGGSRPRTHLRTREQFKIDSRVKAVQQLVRVHAVIEDGVQVIALCCHPKERQHQVEEPKPHNVVFVTAHDGKSGGDQIPVLVHAPGLLKPATR